MYYPQGQQQQNHSQYPCPFHLARGELYYHSAMVYHLPAALTWNQNHINSQTQPQPNRTSQLAHPAITQGAQNMLSTPCVEIINFQSNAFSQSDILDNYDLNIALYDNGNVSTDNYGQGLYDNYQINSILTDPDGYQNFHQSHYNESEHPRDNTSEYFVHSPVSFSCNVCRSSFPFHNKLFKYIH
jgi:hypothetical protein